MSRLGKNGLSRVGRGRVSHTMSLVDVRYSSGLVFLPDSDEAMTLSCWVKREGPASIMPICQFEAMSFFTGFRWFVTSSAGWQRLQAYTSGTTSVDLNIHTELPSLPNHNWNHFAVTKAAALDASAYQFYLNGQPVPHTVVDDQMTGTWINGDVETLVGGYVGSHGNFDTTGTMKNLIAFASELSAGDIADIYNLTVDAQNEALPAAALCRYRMDDPTQAVGTLVDSSGNGRDLTLSTGSASYIRGGSRPIL